MLTRLLKAYLRRRHGITEPWQRIKPPLGWSPWARVSLRRRLRYALAHRFWRFESWLCDRAFAHTFVAELEALGLPAPTPGEPTYEEVRDDLLRSLLAPSRFFTVPAQTRTEPTFIDGAGI